ncbi:fumarylacetoacetate hydrolase family protein [Phaeobacter gallaeciensis]|uniref:2-keto-4-pentenoate hydratase/2-oxohepta-3-ene-1,7-dioic acid hydratase (Catechol pathway) n=1 Tax=Phaeobacter gallaeciensis TaxID=60890 RepID=A0AAC9ZCR7_9RHOB|nr:fumarylacetoacetate hydrolase family protein [Phaeobacter gallaeciensis]AHD11874.1 2-keto-4-pentenoate hydratase/2-oxohepta-3-ene-1,7-dioic acid hydratase (catechol pathway) [Phaeobacter gallaeciensis DSM 26640]ATE95137.1 2-keto-4-pentenoate hydratase/2-oxohepta-3-ene-1,7-dioic acid hydratase (catechol pathway) [Phaeobacter gallaeciensis]ATE99445.1 2-keto-4-pentenoate hydratase/2-oxohepta-3-ene-1,7-dioic acid hydratase (catechol pathway) [Phaeobacter gallaeciensis]ATF03842.1 2-keto-4-penteno
MKLISFTRLGAAGVGALVPGGIVDLTGKLRPDVTSLKALIAADLMEAAARYTEGRSPDFTLTDAVLLPVIPDAGKILCVGLNYETHRAETKRPDAKHPTMFARYPDSQIAHGQPMIMPAISDKLDYEGELAVIIGRGGRCIPEETALSHVAGYACYNDGTIRDWQRHTHQFGPGKTFPGTGGFGPCMVTADEVGDYTKLPIQTRLNGEVMQDATLSDLIFPIERLISYISTYTPLSAGDVIVTGTPGGVGDRRDPPLYMKPGDVVEVEIGMLGTLTNPIMAESTS